MFLNRARLEQIDWRDGRPVFLTLAPLRWHSDRLGKILVVPAELVTDLASVPRWALTWWIAGGRGIRSAILHDFPYLFGYWLDGDGNRIPVEKPVVDDEFHVSLLADPISGAGPATAQLMYRAVQVGGRGRWKDVERTAALNPEWTREGWIEAP